LPQSAAEADIRDADWRHGPMLSTTSLDFEFELPAQVIECVPHIPTFCRLLEEGHFV